MDFSSSLKPVGGGSHSRRNRGRRTSKNDSGGGGGDDGDGSNSIPLLQVSCKDEWYPMENCVTVGDVLDGIKSNFRSSGPKEKAVVIVHGKVLDDPKSLLRDHGVRNGDTVLVMLGNSLKPHEALAMFLVLIESGGSNLAKLVEHWREHGLGDYLPNVLPRLQSQQVSQGLRNAVDLGYHRLRSWWEQPIFRQALLQPNSDIYRKVLQRHLPPMIQKELSPAAKQILQSPEAWQQEIGKVCQIILQSGDVIMDGLLDVVLDIVQGAGRNRQESSLSARFGSGSSSRSSSASTSSLYEPTMDDPSLANQMLFELSESEED